MPWNRNGQPQVYLMLNTRNLFTKIGVSINPEFREKTLQSEEPEITLACCIDAGADFERVLHRRFAQKRLRGEWFNLGKDDYQEIFQMYCSKLLIEDDIAFNAMAYGVSFQEVYDFFEKQREDIRAEGDGIYPIATSKPFYMKEAWGY